MDYIQDRANFIASCVVNIPIDIIELIFIFLHSKYNNRFYNRVEKLLIKYQCPRNCRGGYVCERVYIFIPIKYVECDWNIIFETIQGINRYDLGNYILSSCSCKKIPHNIRIQYLHINNIESGRNDRNIHICFNCPKCSDESYILVKNIIYDGVVRFERMYKGANKTMYLNIL